ncbi:MAG: shikimate kinase [Myxococcota bacterium]
MSELEGERARGGSVASGAVWLVGMMGAGKSTVGPVLARALGRAFVDTDEAIVASAGRSISAIFEHEGEAAFRARERAAMADAASRAAVVALGGGAIAQDGAPAWLAERGVVVYLRATPRTLCARVGDAADRPLLASLSAPERLARIEALLAAREPAYATARVVVDVDGPGANGDAPQVAARIAARLRALPDWEDG